MSSITPANSKRISIHALREEGDKLRNANQVTYKYFYPRPPRGGRPAIRTMMRYISIFLSTPSARRATKTFAVASNLVIISIHALREEGDQELTQNLRYSSNFYPRPPRGGRLLRELLYGQILIFLSTPSARRATCQPRAGHFWRKISIHALREEGDILTRRAAFVISIFLSTPSARRATKFRCSF